MFWVKKAIPEKSITGASAGNIPQIRDAAF
jgi:hypothetical protein